MHVAKGNRNQKRGSKVNRSPKQAVKSEVAYDILSYLLKHPDAEGPIEAITEWWLLEERIEAGMKEIANAINELTKRGLLLERRSPDRRAFYRINPEKDKVIRQLLESKRSLKGE